MPYREGGSAFRRGATKHQIKKVMRVVSKMTKILSLFLFSFFFLKKFKKRRGGRRLGREGIASLVAHVLSFYEKRRIRVTRTNARDVSSTEQSIRYTFRAFETFLLLLLFFTKQKKDTKENQFLRKINLSIGNHHERDDGKKPKRPTERATRTTNGRPGRVREGEDNATLRAN